MYQLPTTHGVILVRSIGPGENLADPISKKFLRVTFDPSITAPIYLLFKWPLQLRFTTDALIPNLVIEEVAPDSSPRFPQPREFREILDFSWGRILDIDKKTALDNIHAYLSRAHNLLLRSLTLPQNFWEEYHLAKFWKVPRHSRNIPWGRTGRIHLMLYKIVSVQT